MRLSECCVITQLLMAIIVLVSWCPSGGDAVFQELPTLVTLVAAGVPPVLIGTDSRVAFGYRFGEHVDFQTILDIGPQTHTKDIVHNALDRSDFTRRRDISHLNNSQRIGPNKVGQHNTPKHIPPTSRKPLTTTLPPTTTTASDSVASRYLRQWVNRWNTIDTTTTRKPSISTKSSPTTTKVPTTRNKNRPTKPSYAGFKWFRQIFSNLGWHF